MQLHPELHRLYVERAADLNCEKLPNTSHQKRILNLVLKNR